MQIKQSTNATGQNQCTSNPNFLAALFLSYVMPYMSVYKKSHRDIFTYLCVIRVIRSKYFTPAKTKQSIFQSNFFFNFHIDFFP